MGFRSKVNKADEGDDKKQIDENEIVGLQDKGDGVSKEPELQEKYSLRSHMDIVRGV